MAHNRLLYKNAAPLFVVRGAESEKARAKAWFESHYAEALALFRGLTPRNREGAVAGRSLQDYYCIGCDVAEGGLRADILGFAAYPLHQVLMQELVGEQLALQCYFAQTYEPESGEGPGGIIGSQPQRAVQERDASASRAYKYWHWVDRHVPEYLSEEEAEIALWKLAAIGFSRGKFWLANLPDRLPHAGARYPAHLKHELHALLGVEAMRRLVVKHLGKDVVLLDADTIIERENMHWGFMGR